MAKKPNVDKLLRIAGSSLRKHAPEILTGVAVLGMAGAVVTGIRVTPTAVRILESEAKDRGSDWRNLPKKDIFRLTWKLYLPTAVMMLVSGGSMIFSTRTSIRRNAAIAAAYTLSEATMREYMESTLKNVGPKKEADIRSEAAQACIDSNPIDQKTFVLKSDADMYCYDPYSGRYFSSNPDKINRAMIELSRDLIDYTSVSLNDFYRKLDVEELEVTDTGEVVGWNVDWVPRGLIEPNPSTRLSTCGRPCYVLDFNHRPRINYDR